MPLLIFSTLIMNWREIAEPNLALFSSANGGVQWLNMGEDAIDQGADILSLGGIDILNRFTLANISAPLSVRLIRFYVIPSANDVMLHWVTSSETNNQYLAVERAPDGLHFMEIGQVPGYGTISQEQQYQFIDQLPLSGKSWYRLRQVDIDGKINYTPVLMISRDFKSLQQASIFPNPVIGTSVYLNFNTSQTGAQTFMLYNQGGVLLKQFSVNLSIEKFSTGRNQTGPLPAGIYFIRQQGDAGFGLKFLKQ